MKALVLNCGSSSIKFSCFSYEEQELLWRGSIMLHENKIKLIIQGKDIAKKEIFYHSLLEVFEYFINDMESKNDIVIHRIVHGLDKFTKPIILDDYNLKILEQMKEYAPLHTPQALKIIYMIKEKFPGMLNVAVFDTSFHQTIPEENYRYDFPTEYLEKYKIRKYGFHGISYQYVLDRLVKIRNIPLEQMNAIICHFGGGSSMCLIKEGKSLDTTMGFMPFGGMMMPSRSSIIDSSVIPYLMSKTGFSYEKMMELLNNYSGYKSWTGISDEKTICDMADEHQEKAIMARKRAEQLFKHNLGGYLFQNPKVDVVAFTGGMGSKNYRQRALFLSGLESFGLLLDFEKNKLAYNQEISIHQPSSKIQIYVIPTNEELQMLKEAQKVLKLSGEN